MKPEWRNGLTATDELRRQWSRRPGWYELGEVMYASVSLLLSKTGPVAAELFRHFFRTKDKLGPVTRFVRTYPVEADQWVGVSPEDRTPLSKAQLAELLSVPAEKLPELARELGVSEDETVRIADRALFQAVQMAAPDGMRVSQREAMRLDEDLGSAIGTGSSARP